ncbi:hypothetical protein [Acidithiobacillus thiooxidans]|uniref:hypothetical protein n=1 Tax=Acidithiobacillus thiooxidans TaxID=930 RepID=UPI003563948A|nr:hypothetical protein [Acidithiobacillus sp.]
MKIINIIAQGGFGGYTLCDRLKKVLPHAVIHVITRRELTSVSENEIYIIAGYDDLLEMYRPIGSFLIYGANKSFLSDIKGTGNYSLCHHTSLLKLLTSSPP